MVSVSCNILSPFDGIRLAVIILYFTNLIKLFNHFISLSRQLPMQDVILNKLKAF